MLVPKNVDKKQRGKGPKYPSCTFTLGPRVKEWRPRQVGRHEGTGKVCPLPRPLGPWVILRPTTIVVLPSDVLSYAWVNIKATKELCPDLCIYLKTKCMHIVRPTNERESHMDTQQQHIAMTPTSHPTHAPSPSKKYYFTSKRSEDFPCK
jgi:hypothetical protein